MNSKILMADGSVKYAEEIEVGDMLIGPDGKHKTVTDCYTDTLQLYNVNQSSGSSYTVSEHSMLIVNVLNKHLFEHDNYGLFYNDDTKYWDISVPNYLEMPQYLKNNLRGIRAGGPQLDRNILFLRSTAENILEYPSNLYYSSNLNKIRGSPYLTKVNGPSHLNRINTYTKITLTPLTNDAYVGFFLDGNRLYLNEDYTIIYGGAYVM